MHSTNNSSTQGLHEARGSTSSTILQTASNYLLLYSEIIKEEKLWADKENKIQSQPTCEILLMIASSIYH